MVANGNHPPDGSFGLLLPSQVDEMNASVRALTVAVRELTRVLTSPDAMLSRLVKLLETTRDENAPTQERPPVDF